MTYRILPPHGSIILNNDNARVDFPDPVLPTCTIYGKTKYMPRERYTYDSDLLRRFDCEGQVSKNGRQVGSISNNQVIHNELAITGWPVCRWSAILDNSCRLLWHAKVFHYTLDRVKIELKLRENPSIRILIVVS